jgi:hypothetical protein
MASTQGLPEEHSPQESTPRPRVAPGLLITGVLGIAVVLAAISYPLLSGVNLSSRSSTSSSTAPQNAVESSEPPLKPAPAGTRLTRDSIDLLLDAFDQAFRQKDADGVLRLLAPDAAITIHMTQGAQQQVATLTREDYRKTLEMEFAFPSANDFTRQNTTITLAPDERSAKVSFKSTETLRHAEREIVVEGEATLVLSIREDRPMITSLEQVVPGDST